METPAQRCARIMTSLEDLAAQEAAALANRDFTALVALQERTEPLVDFFVRTAPGYLNEPGLRARLSEFQRLRQKTSDALAVEIEHTRAELLQTRAAQRRAAQIAPAYGQLATRRRQLQAVG